MIPVSDKDKIETEWMKKTAMEMNTILTIHYPNDSQDLDRIMATTTLLANLILSTAKQNKVSPEIAYKIIEGALRSYPKDDVFL